MNPTFANALLPLMRQEPQPNQTWADRLPGVSESDWPTSRWLPVQPTWEAGGRAVVPPEDVNNEFYKPNALAGPIAGTSGEWKQDRGAERRRERQERSNRAQDERAVKKQAFDAEWERLRQMREHGLRRWYHGWNFLTGPGPGETVPVLPGQPY